MRQRTRIEATKDLQKKAGKEIAKSGSIYSGTAPSRQELISVRADQMKRGEISLEEFAHELRLTPVQIAFCKEYTKPECLGDHTNAYAIAANLNLNDPEDYQKAKTGGLRNAGNVACCTLINALLEAGGFSQENARKQLLFLLNQMADKKTKLAALKLFYAVTGELKNHTEVVHKHVFDYSALEPDKLQVLIDLKEQVKLKESFKPSPDFSKIVDYEAEIIPESKKEKKKSKCLAQQFLEANTHREEPVKENIEEPKPQIDLDDDPQWPDED